MTDWILHDDQWDKILTGLIQSLNKFKELETLELSYNDAIADDGMQDNTLMRVAKEVTSLKTIRIHGGVLSDEMQAELKRIRPELVIECLP